MLSCFWGERISTICCKQLPRQKSHQATTTTSFNFCSESRPQLKPGPPKRTFRITAVVFYILHAITITQPIVSKIKTFSAITKPCDTFSESPSLLRTSWQAVAASTTMNTSQLCTVYKKLNKDRTLLHQKFCNWVTPKQRHFIQEHGLGLRCLGLEATSMCPEASLRSHFG